MLLVEIRAEMMYKRLSHVKGLILAEAGPKS